MRPRHLQENELRLIKFLLEMLLEDGTAYGNPWIFSILLNHFFVVRKFLGLFSFLVHFGHTRGLQAWFERGITSSSSSSRVSEDPGLGPTKTLDFPTWSWKNLIFLASSSVLFTWSEKYAVSSSFYVIYNVSSFQRFPRLCLKSSSSCIELIVEIGHRRLRQNILEQISGDPFC